MVFNLVRECVGGGGCLVLLSWNRLRIEFPSGHFANFVHCSNSSMIDPHWIMLSFTRIILHVAWPTLMIVLCHKPHSARLPQHTAFYDLELTTNVRIHNNYAHASSMWYLLFFYLWAQPQHAFMHTCVHVHIHTHRDTHTHKYDLAKSGYSHQL